MRVVSKSLAFSAAVGVDEFHTSEVVHPPKRSLWRRISPEVRLRLLHKAIDILKRTTKAIPYCLVSGEQYDEELRPKIRAARAQPRRAKLALEHVFFNALIPYLQTTGDEVAIVVDSPVALSREIRIQSVADPTRIYEKGVIFVDSRDEVGIQLADLAAYMANRLYHIRERPPADGENSFDAAIAAAMFDLRPKLVNVLELRPHDTVRQGAS